ncbi:MAG: hypothetical protein WD491_00525 [Balneolales bacterium]
MESFNAYTESKSGVRIANEFRDNLIIDRYHPCFLNMRSSKLKHMCSENSEDVATWNVFHSLRQIKPTVWLPTLFKTAFPNTKPPILKDSTITQLWKSIKAPTSLLENGDEGDSEIDIFIKSPDWVWVIEAKLKSDISSRTTTRNERDQILRNIDVGSYYSGVREFYFSLLVLDEKKTPKGAAKINEYESLELPRALLRDHRPDQLSNLKGVSMITWQDLADVLSHANETNPKEDEKIYSSRSLAWLGDKKYIVKH